MLENLENVSWSAEEQPHWNRPGDITAALRALDRVASDAEAQEAYSRLLYVIGNNHAGTYYPVVLKVLPFLGELLRHDREGVRETTLDILTDITISFEPEPRGGIGDTLRSDLQAELRQLRDVLRERAGSEDASMRERQLALRLLNHIEGEGT